MNNFQRGNTSKRDFNSPDYVNFEGLELNVSDQNAYGFMCNTKEHKLMFTPKGGNHQSFSVAYTKHLYPSIKGGDLILKAKEILSSFDLQGRIWLNVSNYDAILTTWDAKIDKKAFNGICKKFSLTPSKVVYVFGNKQITLDKIDSFGELNDEEMRQNDEIHALHNLPPQEKWDKTEIFRNARNRILAQRNKEDGWGNATQAEINWWKNKGLDEGVEDDEFTIGDEGDGNLGYFHIKENTNFLNENLEFEYQAYHGSRHDFDKFNHKKYLSTGAGSQVFGWGTYVTDDEAIAKSYTEIGDVKDNIVVMLNGTAIDSHLPDEDDAEMLMKCVLPTLKQDYPTVYNYYVYELNKDEKNELFYELYEELFDKNSYTDKLKNMYQLDKNSCDNKIKQGYWWEEFNPNTILLELCRYILFLCNKVEMNEEGSSKLVYTVDIPDDNGENYIDWYEYFPPKFMKRILIGLSQLKPKYLEKMAEKNYPFKQSIYSYIIAKSPNQDKLFDILSNEEDYYTFFANNCYSHKKEPIGSHVYHRLREILGSPKAASLFLMQCGFVGVKYPTGTRMQKPIDAREDGQNYVIFDANNVKIVNKQSY